MVHTAMAVGLGSASTLLLLMLLSWKWLRFWPPDEQWKQLLYWVLALVNLGALLLAAGKLALVGPIGLKQLIGGLLVVLGLAGTGVAVAQLGLRRTAGGDGSLVTDGLYSRSRHPQIVANLVVLVGLVLLAPGTATLAAVTAAWLIVMALAEERWLQAEYGDAYSRYRDDVPRFV
ncbi:MAG: methyltransferase [Candidatus Nanohaloarchaea archaeon]|nr:methyltransferase [Candidatus Nanohaloarchaea archaeon]